MSSTTTSTTAQDRFICSLVAAAIAETLTLPLDVIKTRLQTSSNPHVILGEVTKRRKTSHGIAKELINEGGVQALWKGLSPSLLRQMLYTSMSFLFYDPVRDRFMQAVRSPITGLVTPGGALRARVLAGGLSGAVGIAIMNWTVVLKVKSQTMQNSNVGMVRLCQHIYHTDGWWGFFRGVKSNMLRTFVVNAVEIGVYDHIRDVILLMIWGPVSMDDSSTWIFVLVSFIVTMLTSFMVGMLSAIFSSPFDTISTLLMEEAGTSGTGLNIMNLIRKEGVFILWQGFGPICLRKTLWVFVFWGAYEILLVRRGGHY